MCFYGALGYVKIASDFRIVTALKQQIDDLLLPVPHLTNILFHSLHLNGCASDLPQVAERQSDPTRDPRLGSLCTPLCIRETNPPPFCYQSVKICRTFHFSPKNQWFSAARNRVGQGSYPCQTVVLLRF
jgi:hypothetical protein